MKYLSEWDQWKRYSSKSWKRFLEKAREMTTHLELWRDDIRSIGGTTPHTLHVLLHNSAWGEIQLRFHELSAEIWHFLP